MLVINNFPNRKYIETISVLSYSFKNVDLIDVAVHSITLFYKGISYSLIELAQFNYARNSINIQLYPEDFLPIKKCVFHVEIKYSRKNSNTIEHYRENIKFVPRTFDSVKTKRMINSEKVVYKEGYLEVEEMLINILQDIQKNSASIWRNKEFDSKIELALIVRGKSVFLSKKHFDKFVDKKVSKKTISALSDLGYIKTYRDGKRTTTVKISVDSEKEVSARVFVLSNVLLNKLNERGINFK